MIPIRGKDRDGGAICLAVLRRDGFISLDAGEASGVLETEPFILPGKQLYLNADAHDGEVQATLLDTSGRSLATSEPITGDQPRARVVWKIGSVAEYLGDPVVLRLKLRNASVYSYWLAP